MSLILQIYKRDGRLVNFDADKIKRAIGKAFIEVQGSVNEDVLVSIVNEVSAELEANFTNDRSPAVEDVQNLVEMILMKNDFYIVAKAYIIYRYEHSKIRDQAIEEVLEKIAT